MPDPVSKENDFPPDPISKTTFAETDLLTPSRRGFFGQLATAGATLAGLPLLKEEASALPSESTPALTAALPSAPAALQSVTLNINGSPQTLMIAPNVTLLDALRERLDLTGTKKGCNHGQCGACTVLVNGRRMLSCLSLALAYEGDEIITIEGLANGDDLHPIQAAFIEHDAYQCGYCTPGQICSAVGAINEAKAGMPSHVTPDVRASFTAESLSDLEIRERMSGNICRCGAYANIVAAMREVAKSNAGATLSGGAK